MIKYDYLITRNEGDADIIYKPDKIPSELSNIVYIQGPNSSGKSTLLHILALAFFGLKLEKDELPVSLKEKLENLVYSNHQNLQFEIHVTDKNNSIEIISKKSDPNKSNIEVKLKNEEREYYISPEEFSRKYKLIYDVPNNPLQRLPQILTEVKIAQNKIGNRIGILRRYIASTINAVKDSKDPSILDLIKKRIDEQNKNKEILKNKLHDKRKFKSQFHEFYITKIYREVADTLQTIISELQEAKTKKTSVEKKVRKISKEQDQLLKEIKNNVKNTKQQILDITVSLKPFFQRSEKNHFDLWLSSSIENEIYQPEIYQTIRNEGKYFQNLLLEYQGNADSETISQTTLFISLRKVLIEYSSSDIVIPGTDKNIKEFIRLLDDEIQKHEELIKYQDNLAKTILQLGTLLEDVNELIELVAKYKSISSDQKIALDGIDSITSSSIIEVLLNQQEKLEKKKDFYTIELGKLGIDTKEVDNLFSLHRNSSALSIFNNYNENQLMDKLNSLSSEIIKLEDDIKKADRNIQADVIEYQRIERKEPHKYQDYYAELTHLFEIAQDLEKNFLVTFDGYLAHAMKAKPSDLLNDDLESYLSSIGIFLAEKIKTIRHIDKNYLSKSIDIWNKQIATKSGKIIKFSDMGTGQSQSAYLEGLLSINDNRKIIALFDEVAMLDSNSLNPILSKLKELYVQNKLLLGIVVQKADTIKVEPLI